MTVTRALKSYTFLLFSFLYLPLSVMAVFSFNDAVRNVVWKGFTLRWYVELARDRAILDALWMSVKVGLASSLAACVLGFLSSYVLVCHQKVKGKGAYDTAFSVPLMIPEVVFGVALLTFFARIQLPLSFTSLVLAHVVFILPYVVGSVKARLQSLHSASLEEAAMDLGASEWQAFLRITLPLAWPAILSGGLLAFTISFEDFVISFFVSGPRSTTLPIKIYSMMKSGVTPEINALSTLFLLLTAVILYAQHRLGEDEAATRH